MEQDIERIKAEVKFTTTADILKEAAKRVCWMCSTDDAVYYNERNGNYYHVSVTLTGFQADCKASILWQFRNTELERQRLANCKAFEINPESES